jgi:hypothetical protein
MYRHENADRLEGIKGSARLRSRTPFGGALCAAAEWLPPQLSKAFDERRGRLNQSDLRRASDCGGQGYDLSSGG